MGEVISWILGMGLGVLIALTAVDYYSQKRLTACEEEHNIFRCEWVAQPAPPPSHT